MKNSTGARQQRIFISNAGENKAERRALFENQVLRLLSMRTEDYVATLDAERVMDAFAAHATSSGDETEDADRFVADSDAAIGDIAYSPQNRDVLSRLADRKKGGAARAFTRSTEILEGTHNAEALATGRELVEIAAQRQPRGIWQVIAGKVGSGKTEILVHLACLAYQRGVKVAIIDLDPSRVMTALHEEPFAEAAGADLVLIDNAQHAPHSSPGLDNWWNALERHLRKSACVVVAATPGTLAAVDALSPRREDASRETEIGSFDCDFRRALIGELDRRQHAERGGSRMTDAAVNRLAEELWGNGWQLADGVEACRGYANVMARDPRPEEIDEIAVNVGASTRQVRFGHAAFFTALERGCDIGPLSKEQQHELAFYVTRTITGQPLETIGKAYGFGREAAVQAIARVECCAREDDTIRRLIGAVQSELNGRPHNESGSET